ncbi:MAG: extracellular solute-binding protein [Planctomycetota bacterium]
MSSCTQNTEQSEASATILVWHDWPDPQSAALEELLRGFEEVYPNIRVVVEYRAKDDLRDAFIDQAAAGLGPDLLIESDLAVVADLHAAGLLVDLNDADIETNDLLEHAVDALRADGGLYGIPFAAHTNVLYFNRNLIDSPPDSIEALRSPWSSQELSKPLENGGRSKAEQPDEQAISDKEERSELLAAQFPDENEDSIPIPDPKAENTKTSAEDPVEETDAESMEKAKERVAAQIGSFVGRHDGRQVALATDFFHAFWGIRAFGGSAFDDGGQLTVDDGFREWLAWLLEIQRDTTIILDNNYKDLVEAFASGRTALMIGDSAEYVELQRKLGVDVLGVATLPKGATPGGGLLELEVACMSKLSAKKEICTQVIGFLCNESSQRKIALSEVGQIPVNKKIRFNPRLMPVAATLNRQIQRTSIISLSNVRRQERMFEIGNSIYLGVLAGELNPEDAMEELQEQFDRFNAMESGS